jgi:hypothetical protein
MAWTEVDAEAPVMQNHSEKQIMVSVINGKANVKHEASDTSSDSEKNSDNSCKAVANVNKVKQSCPTMPCRHQEGEEYSPYSFLTLALDGW